MVLKVNHDRHFSVILIPAHTAFSYSDKKALQACYIGSPEAQTSRPITTSPTSPVGPAPHTLRGSVRW